MSLREETASLSPCRPGARRAAVGFCRMGARSASGLSRAQSKPAPGQFSILWRTPLLSGMRLPVVLKLPDDVQNVKEPIVQELTDSLVERRWIDAGPERARGKAH